MPHLKHEVLLYVFQHLWQMLVQDADLLGHLRIIKDFYLLGRGELYLAFIDQAQHLLRVPATANTEHGKIFSLFTHCILVNSSTVIC